MATKLTDPIYHNEDAARAHFEAIRWPDGRVCPHCGTTDNSTTLNGKSTRAGLYKCKDCWKPFTATIGTIYERSHIPLHKWLLATHLMVSSKKGISSAQLHRNLGFGSYRTAWFMSHRIREAMQSSDTTLMGGNGADVEVDETYIGRTGGNSRTAIHNMNKVISLVDRVSGRATSLVFTGQFTANTVAEILNAHVAPDTRLLTDEARFYKTPGKAFADHQSVAHARGEYVKKADRTVHTNTIEGFFGIFKRGMRGIYQHCGSQHLHRYLAEFDFRYTNREGVGTNDTERAKLAVQGVVGRRLMYKRCAVAA